MKRPFIIIISVVVVFLLLGTIVTSMFGGSASPTGMFSANRSLGYGGGGGGATDMGMAPAATQAPAPEAPAAQEAFGSPTGSNAVQAAQERKVIKNDQLSLVVKDPEQSMKDMIALAEQMGGYVVTSNLYQSNYGPNNTPVPQAQIVMRVPAEKLTETLDLIKKAAIEVQSENLTGQDVTDQYVDLQSRLAADQAAADQLLKIMQSADKTEDVLNVYQQLRQVQSDIEVLKGQIKYIDQSTATSEISATLIAEESVQPIEVGGWKLQGTTRNAVQDLIDFTQGFVRFLIRFVIFTLPALILIAIPLTLVFLAGRAVYRRFRKPSVPVEEKEEVVKK